MKLLTNRFDTKTTQWARCQVGRLYEMWDGIYRFWHAPPTILSIEDTLRHVISNNYSMSRFGDGEINLIAGKDRVNFQPYYADLAKKTVQSVEQR